MPFITIEISGNLQFSLQPFALLLHHYLADALSCPIERFKTKLVRFPEAFLGSGAEEASYARLKVECMSGRERQKLIVAGKELVKRFGEQIQKDNPKTGCRITAEFHEIDRDLLYTPRC